MFATFTIEKPLIQWHDLPFGFEYWVQNVGTYAMVFVVLWLIVGLPRMQASDRERIPGWQKFIFGVAALAGLVLFGVYFSLRFPEIRKTFAIVPPGGKPELMAAPTARERVLYTVASCCALVAACLPFLRSLWSFRVRRIYALAKLSFKEALRRRVLYAFSALLLVFLFASWFIPAKPEDEVRSYVQVVFTSMTLLLIFTAAFLAAFSIPTDIRQLTIHTVVTKPVEKFEIVLGRFLGFTALMTVVLFLMTGISLIWVVRGVGEDARAESLKARVPVYGSLFFENATSKYRADNVGREWEYRSYISAPHTGTQEAPVACWGFPYLTGAALQRDRVRCEFTLDIYRTTKGEENKGVSCQFTFHTGRYNRDRENAYRQARETKRRSADAASESQIDNALAEEYGFFEVPSMAVVDYHTQSIDVPAALFVRAQNEPPGQLGPDQPQELPVQVRVKCLSRTQYVGMALYDLYFRMDNPESGADTLLFSANFFKGAMGLWFRLCLVIGIAVCLSTYLTGVISMLLALLLFLGGLSQDFIQTVAVGTNIGGGPTESLIRLVGREAITTPRDDSTAQRVAAVSDNMFRWLIRRVLDLMPDVDRYDLTNYVAEGFNISGPQLGIDALLMIAYLLPWFVLAYFVMKWREIATW